MSSIIKIHNISKDFGSLTALDGINITVPQHSIFGILGPNGAGKTTLFSIIAGFIKPNAGKVIILGQENTLNLKGRMSILPQDALFQTNIPIIDQLTFFLRLMGRSLEQAEHEVRKVLHLVELDKSLYKEAATLSHGMYKRLSLAQAFLGEPEIIILDEPTSGLDWKSAKKIRKLIKELQAQATILVSSHNMEEMHELCDHVAILDNGKLMAVGPVDVVTGTSISVSCILNRDLDANELTEGRTIEGLKNIVPLDIKKYNLIFKPTLGYKEIDKITKTFLTFLLKHDIVIRSYQENNRLEEHYLKVTMQE